MITAADPSNQPNEARLQLLRERMLDDIMDYAIILLDLDGTILSWNRGAEMIKGYKAEEIIGENFSVFYLEEEKEDNAPRKLLKQAKHEGRAKYIGRRLKKDGSSFWGSMLVSAIHDDEGRVIGFVKLTREIKE